MAKPKYPDWLRDGILYQIYPSSFQDSNGDGIGDLEGIRQRLDYISSLGVNTIWLNPCFDSPFADGGYDVRDFKKVAPRYGTTDDLARLFKEAGDRGLRVILDLVAGHTSIEHRWFKASAASPEGPMADRYIWKNREFDPATGPTEKNYVHNFFWFQPALNFGYARPTEPWQDPVDAPGPKANREALREIMAYWMDLGAAGFRVDMASSLVKEDEGHRETIKLWQGLREWLDHHYPGRVLIAEWSYPSEATEAGFHLDFLMHFNLDVYRSLFFNGTGTLPYPDGDCYFDKKGTGTPHIFLPTYLDELRRVSGRGLISMPTANHDFQHLRCGNRDRDDLEVAWVFLMSQAGPPTIYMGDEIGMRFVEGTPPKEGSTLKGVTAPNAGSPQGERAGTRTPMQWDASANAGFSTASAEDLYLPLDPDPERPHVAAQEADPDSLLNFIRRLIRLRQQHPALGTEASFKPLTPPEISYPLVIERRLPGEACLILLNPSSREVSWPLPPEVLLDSGPWLEKGCRLEEMGGQRILRIRGRGYAMFPLA